VIRRIRLRRVARPAGCIVQPPRDTVQEVSWITKTARRPRSEWRVLQIRGGANPRPSPAATPARP
jgi:hypothetical protein